MDIIPELTQLGLNKNQATIYLAALQLGSSTIAQLANSTILKRPSVYLIVDELERRGLLKKNIKGKKTFWQATDPTELVRKAQQQLQQANQLLPALKAVHNLDPVKPNIMLADGVAQVRAVYNQLFTYLRLHPQEELLIYGALSDTLEYFVTEVIDYFYSQMKQSKNVVREIGNDDAATRRYYRQSHRLNPRHDIRLINPRHGHFWQTDNMLYGDTLIIFSVREQIFAITLQSPNIAVTYRTLFNMAWRSGRPL